MAGEQRNALVKGSIVGGYRIERVLGAGGFGITYLATDTDLQRAAAIKEYLPSSLAMRAVDGSTVEPLNASDAEDFEFGLERFRQEAQTLARFSHPNIVAVHKYFEANGTAYLSMAYVEGESLFERLRRRTVLTQAEIRDLLIPILEGLEQVHAGGFLHRDIKPGNIFIREDGSPVLLDFGAARFALGAKSMSLTSIFTPGYAPFEQYSARGEQGAWTDIYSLAATAYRCITGTKPPDAADRAHRDDYVPAADAAKGAFDPAFLAAIDAGLQFRIEDRPQSVREWRQSLEVTHPSVAVARPAGEAALDPGTVQTPSAAKRPGRRGLKVAAASLAVVLLVAGGAVGYQQYQAVREERARADAERKRLAAELKRLEQDRKRRAAEAAQRKAEEDRKRQAALEAERRRETERRRQAEIERKRQAAEAEKRRQAVLEAERERQAALEAERKRQAALEAERKRQAALEVERKRQAAIEAERKRQAALEAERKRIAAAEADKRRKEKAAADLRRKAAAAAAKKRQAAREAKRRSAAVNAKQKPPQTAALPPGAPAAKSRPVGYAIAAVVPGKTASWTGPSQSGFGTVRIRLVFRSNGTFTRTCTFFGNPNRPPSPCQGGNIPNGVYSWDARAEKMICLQYNHGSPCLRLLGSEGRYRLQLLPDPKIIFDLG